MMIFNIVVGRRILLLLQSILIAILFVLPLADNSKSNAVITESADHSNDDYASTCLCPILDRPNVLEKTRRARWMVHSLNFGVLSTISTRVVVSNGSTSSPVPFGNVISFADGLCDTSSGIPYFYGTYMDQSFIDIQSNPIVSFTLSEAFLPTLCPGVRPIKACSSFSGVGDPENPVCARLTLTGTLVELRETTATKSMKNNNSTRLLPPTTAETSTAVVLPEQDDSSDDDEYQRAKAALFQRHPLMQYWPHDHNWIVAKLEIHDIWFLDYFGGPSILSIAEYLAINLFLPN